MQENKPDFMQINQKGDKDELTADIGDTIEAQAESAPDGAHLLLNNLMRVRCKNAYDGSKWKDKNRFSTIKSKVKKVAKVQDKMHTEYVNNKLVSFMKGELDQISENPNAKVDPRKTINVWLSASNSTKALKKRATSALSGSVNNSS